MAAEEKYITPGACDKKHDELRLMIRIISDDLKKLNNRLYIDNGSTSIQTRLDRHEQVIRSIIWSLRIIGTAVIVASLSLIWAAIKSSI